MQNLNQRTAEQKEELERKRREALKQYTGCAIIFQYCVQKGKRATWELSPTCQAWRLPLIQQLLKKLGLFQVVTRGCQGNLRNENKESISKGWKLMTSHQLLAMRMDLPCRCAPNTKHVPCEGKLTRMTAFYTKVFAKQACEAILQGYNHDMIQQDMEGRSMLSEWFGMGTSYHDG